MQESVFVTRLANERNGIYRVRTGNHRKVTNEKRKLLNKLQVVSDCRDHERKGTQQTATKIMNGGR